MDRKNEFFVYFPFGWLPLTPNYTLGLNELCWKVNDLLDKVQCQHEYIQRFYTRKFEWNGWLNTLSLSLHAIISIIHIIPCKLAISCSRCNSFTFTFLCKNSNSQKKDKYSKCYALIRNEWKHTKMVIMSMEKTRHKYITPKKCEWKASTSEHNNKSNNSETTEVCERWERHLEWKIIEVYICIEGSMNRRNSKWMRLCKYLPECKIVFVQGAYDGKHSTKLMPLIQNIWHMNRVAHRSAVTGCDFPIKTFHRHAKSMLLMMSHLQNSSKCKYSKGKYLCAWKMYAFRYNRLSQTSIELF